jgi:WD repeat and SOF domain-containing protein 1
MVKVNVVSRSTLQWTKDRDGEVPRANRNFDPKFNPMARQVEYTRAVRAAKLDRMFAKPFVGAMAGHQEAVRCIALDPTNVGVVATGGIDGELIVWDAATRLQRRQFHAHRHTVDSICYTPDGVAFLSASRDRTVKLWDTDRSESGLGVAPSPLAEWLGDSPFNSVDHHWRESLFITAGFNVEVWDVNRTRPVQTHNWGDDTVRTARMNKVEVNLAVCTMQDRGVSIYDIRARAGHSKFILEMACTAACWNPMDPNVFATACDDWNCYLFDIRVPGRPRNVFQGHASAINDIDFSPTGQKFVAGSADHTVRVWDVHQLTKSTSEEMYHTKRMAKVNCVRWSLDNGYLFSGSEDGVIRVWKADAAKPVRPFRGPEEAQFNYMRALKDRYSGFEEVKRIVGQKNTPKMLRRKIRMKSRLQKREMLKEMSRAKKAEVKPLAAKKVVQRLK